MPDWSFLSPVANWSSPRTIEGNVFSLICCLRPPAPSNQIETNWPMGVPAEVSSFWSMHGGGELFRDVEYGQWGLRIFSPRESAEESARYHALQPNRVSRSDLIFGEFLGDSDLVLVDEKGTTYVAAPIDPRDQWYREDSLSSFLRRYVAASGDKYWESDARLRAT